MLFFGNEQLALAGTKMITRDIFTGSKSKTENALLFLENLSRVRKHKQTEPKFKLPVSFEKRRLMSETDGSGETVAFSQDDVELGLSDTFDFDIDESEAQECRKDVILNLGPTKHDRPKDKLFTNFFAMYTENSVRESKQKEKQ